MNVERYEEATHGKSVRTWCEAWGMRAFPPGWLSGHGFIVPGIAAMWLYRTDSKLGFMENAIANPQSTPEERGEAISAMMRTILDECRRLGILYLTGSSGNERFIERLEKLGWRRVKKVHLLVMEVD